MNIRQTIAETLKPIAQGPNCRHEVFTQINERDQPTGNIILRCGPLRDGEPIHYNIIFHPDHIAWITRPSHILPNDSPPTYGYHFYDYNSPNTINRLTHRIIQHHKDRNTAMTIVNAIKQNILIAQLQPRSAIAQALQTILQKKYPDNQYNIHNGPSSIYLDSIGVTGNPGYRLILTPEHIDLERPNLASTKYHYEDPECIHKILKQIAEIHKN